MFISISSGVFYHRLSKSVKEIAVGYQYRPPAFVSVYYVAVRTIVLSRHGSNSARPVICQQITVTFGKFLAFALLKGHAQV